MAAITKVSTTGSNGGMAAGVRGPIGRGTLGTVGGERMALTGMGLKGRWTRIACLSFIHRKPFYAMSDARSRSHAMLLFAGAVAFWTLVGLAFASQLYLSSTLLGRSVSWGQAISYSLTDWYVYAILSWPSLVFARRFPPESAARWRTAGIHLVAGLVFSLVYVVLRALAGQVHSMVIGEPVTFLEIFRPLLLKTFPFNLLIYGVIISVSHAIDYYRKYHERTVHNLELEKHLAEARLQALLRQLKPHFLFNTLNGIASLMHSDVFAADKMLVRLGELLRLTMSHPGQPLTRLREEISFIEKYLEIERIRFRDRLSVKFEIDPAALDADVPSLILQPLVENAIRHGIEPHVRTGQLVLSAQRTATGVELIVRDNGAGQPAGGFTREGIGLGNTRARLLELYGDRHRFELVNHPDGGLVVRVTIPVA
jgi:two-component system LytT family sensor kinase